MRVPVGDQTGVVPAASRVCVVPSSERSAVVPSWRSASYASFEPSGDHARSWISVNGTAGGMASNSVAVDPLGCAT
jgi:hypothetical protein